jgi:uncharacterized protein
MKRAAVPGKIPRRAYLFTGFQALCVATLLMFSRNGVAVAKEPAFKVLAFYSTDVEPDHVHAAKDALAFFEDLAAKNNFVFDATTDWGKLSESDLKPYCLILWLNNFPQTPEQRAAFEKYRTHPVTRQLPATYLAPANEWYLWKPSPRLNRNVHVLVTLDPSNYPIGVKDVITGGDLPVVWTNTKYRMIYMNMGHGEKIYSDATQNELFKNAILWLGNQR